MSVQPWSSGLILGVLLVPIVGAADSSADEQVLKQAQLATDSPSLLAYFRLRTVGEADRHRIDGLIRQLGDSAYAVRDRATAELSTCGLAAVSQLRQASADADVEIARRAERCLAQIERVPSANLSAAMARLIGQRKPEGAVGVLLAFLPYADDESVADELRDALAALALNGTPIDPLLEKALDDRLPIRRGAAAEALIRTRRPEMIARCRKALTDSNVDVRLRAALALVAHAKDKPTVMPMINLMAELPQGAGWRIEEILIRLAGDSAPEVSLGSEDAARKKCRDAWLDWWDKNGATVDLAKLDGTPAMLGHTLLVLRDPRGVSGRVEEINEKLQSLWKIDNLQQPIDAVMTGKDRVLIAEYSNYQVSEREISGKVLWTKRVIMPIAVQRLPDGHTVVASRNQVVEWDEQQRDVFTLRRDQSDIVAATKARSGEVVLFTQSGTCIRIDPKTNKEIASFATGRQYYGYGSIAVLPNGRILITLLNSVVEYDANGGQHWQATFNRPTSVQRLPNGNTLVCSSTLPSPLVAELDRNGKIVWEFKPPDGMAPWKVRRR